MKVLVIVDQGFKIDTGMLESQLKEEVRMNSVIEDGISIFECGKAIPENQEFDWVGLVGVCTAEIEYPIDVEIPTTDDPVGNLITALSAVREGMDTDEAIGEF